MRFLPVQVEPVEGRQPGEGGQRHLGERVVAQVERLERGRKVNSENARMSEEHASTKNPALHQMCFCVSQLTTTE